MEAALPQARDDVTGASHVPYGCEARSGLAKAGAYPGNEGVISAGVGDVH